MRQLIGKIEVKRGIVEELYLSETVRLGGHGAKGRAVKKVLKRAFYCRSHASDYESRARGDG